MGIVRINVVDVQRQQKREFGCDVQLLGQGMAYFKPFLKVRSA